MQRKQRIAEIFAKAEAVFNSDAPHMPVKSLHAVIKSYEESPSPHDFSIEIVYLNALLVVINKNKNYGIHSQKVDDYYDVMIAMLDAVPSERSTVWKDLTAKRVQYAHNILRRCHAVIAKYFCEMGDIERALHHAMQAVDHASYAEVNKDYYSVLIDIYLMLEEGDFHDPLIECTLGLISDLLCDHFDTHLENKEDAFSHIYRELGFLHSMFKENFNINNLSRLEFANQFLSIIEQRLNAGAFTRNANGEYPEFFSGKIFREGMAVPGVQMRFRHICKDMRELTVGLQDLNAHAPLIAAVSQEVRDLQEKVAALEAKKADTPSTNKDALFAKREREEDKHPPAASRSTRRRI